MTRRDQERWLDRVLLVVAVLAIIGGTAMCKIIVTTQPS